MAAVLTDQVSADMQPTSTEVPAIRVVGINHYFGEGEARNQVLFDNNLEIMPGEIVIMTGPSGSGKTTLLTLIGGLRTLQDGSIQVSGREFRRLTGSELVEVRRGVGFIFQRHNLLESLTAYQNVKMALDLHNCDRAEVERRIVAILERMKLGHRIHYKPAKLSGGQRQRVAIARALVNRPRLILADEPTAALDAETGRDVVHYLQELAAEGCTSLIVTHDNRILDVATRIISMVDGRIKSNVAVTETVVTCLFLNRCSLFTGLKPDALAQVAQKMAKETFSPGTAIVRQGEESDKFYLIRKGLADVIIDQGRPTERTGNRLGEGDFFGEIGLLRDETRSATVVALEQLHTYSLTKPDFKAALELSSSLKEQLLKVFFQRQ
jgi:putative ABC transport system ATP-binding protein